MAGGAGARSAARCRLRTRLVDRIVRDARAETGALPLLGFTLSELWPRQRRRILTHEAYEGIGGLEGSLRAHAEAAVTTLIKNGTSEATLRGALLSLLSRNDERMPVTRRLCPVDELPADQQAVIETLVGVRLVTIDTDRAGRRVAELAHEFLVHTWPPLVQLAEDDAAFVRWRSEVEQWQAKGYGLLPDPMIAEARRWCHERPEETESIRDLVGRSEAEQRRQVWELEQARDSAQVAARRANELRLATQATLADRRSARLTETPALAAESLRARRTLHDDAVTPYALDVALPVRCMAHNDWVDAVIFSPDGTRVATASGDRTARVFDAANGAELASYEPSTAIKAVDTKPVEFSVESRLRWVHRRSGLTWDQIAKLFGVSRRAVHSWVAGGRINAANSEHLGAIRGSFNSCLTSPLSELANY